MDKATFDRIIDAPNSISGAEADLLDELVQAFPYCQTAHLLLAKESHSKKSMLYPNKLKRAATYVLDRRVLHRVITTHPINGQHESAELLTTADTEGKHIDAASNRNPITTSQNLALLQELEENLRQIRERKKKENSPFPGLKYKDTLNLNTKKPIVPEPGNNRSESRLGEELDSSLDLKKALKDADALLNYLALAKNEIAQIPAPDAQQRQIIEKFIVTSPTITKASPTVLYPENEDLSKHSTELKGELITENFALILVKQNKIDKAQEIYKKLMLKFPDKSAYFAAKLNELETK